MPNSKDSISPVSDRAAKMRHTSYEDVSVGNRCFMTFRRRILCYFGRLQGDRLFFRVREAIRLHNCAISQCGRVALHIQ